MHIRAIGKRRRSRVGYLLRDATRRFNTTIPACFCHCRVGWGGKSVGLTSPETFTGQLKEYQDENVKLVFKCHKQISQVREMLVDEKAKACYVYRDIRDVVVSIKNKYNRNFISFLREQTIESILNEFQFWTQSDNMYISRYEKMTSDLCQEIRNIAEYLGVDISAEHVEVIACRFSLENQKNKIYNFDYQQNGAGEANNRYDPSSLLHNNHIHSGKNEQWKSELSGLQAAYIEGKFGNWLQACGYTLSQPWLIRKVAGIIYWFALRFYLFGERVRKHQELT